MRIERIKIGVFFLPLLPVVALAQSPVFSSTLTAGVGGAFPVAGYHTNDYHAAPTFSGDYEFRILRHVSAEVGVENILSKYDNYSRNGISVSRERVTLLPFGLRGVVALANKRVELFAGTGGAYFWRTAGGGDYYNESRVLWQANGGGRVALDRRRRLWAGTTLRLYRDLGRPTEEWLSVTGDISFRFGR